MRRTMLVLVAFCGCKNAEIASECDATDCPVGTAPAEDRDLSSAIDLDAAFDPVTYAGELAFKHVGEGSCSLTCVTIEPCDEHTFPVITTTCFTCGFVNASTGEVDQGSCGE